MSGNNSGKNTATIKIAAKSASKREGTGADVGPGDPNAAPSEMPEPVSIPAPPSPSELVVKSSGKTVNSRAIKTIMDPVSLPKSRGGSASTALKSLKTLSSGAAKTANLMDEAAPAPSGSAPKTASGSNPQAATAATDNQTGADEASGGGAPSMAPKTVQSGKSVGAASQNVPPDSGGPNAEQDLAEDGETEPDQATRSVSPSPSTSPSPSQGSGQASTSPASGGIETAPPSSGAAKLSTKSRRKSGLTRSSSSPGHSHQHVHHHAHKHHHAKKGKQKFRYHKRVTVRTHGKTSPSEVMDKVNAKDHQAGITPSSIGEMDTEELMKRAGIKGSRRAHWRVRLRQTKRTTKNGKTVSETKIAYRDSKGNKSIKTTTSPDCSKCGKKLEECKCSAA